VRLGRLDLMPWRERAWLAAPAALFLAANLGYFVAGRAIDASRNAALRRDRANAQARRDSAEADRARAHGEAAHVESVRGAVDAFYARRVGTVDDTMSSTVEEIHQVCRKVGVWPHAISYALASRRGAPLSQMTVSFTVDGDYATLRRLIAAFEQDSRWLVVRSVSLSRRAETLGDGAIALSVATYFYSPEADKPPTSPVGAAVAARETEE
jgi:hypothetical protein